MNTLLQGALKGLEQPIRKRLIVSYLELKRNVAEGRHDSAGISAGKLCEAAIRHLQHRAFGTYTPFGTKIPNFADECRRIISAPSGTGITESEKTIITRALVFLYTMRNKRGIGHIGGDVDPNAIDGAMIGRTADWIVCELIRIHHNLSLEEAQDLVDGLAIRQLPDVWEVAGKKRVLRDGLTAREQALLLLYSCKDQAVLSEDIIAWVEYSNPAAFRSKILSKLHKDRLLEWDRENESVVLSPKGSKYVEDKLFTAQPVASPDAKKRSTKSKSP
jgi:hypothetical protein